MERYLIINLGSSSKKYTFFESSSKSLEVHFEHYNKEFSVLFKQDSTTRRPILNIDYTHSLAYLLNYLQKEISAVGIRVVAPGSFFTQSQLITEEFLQILRATQERASLHITPLLFELKEIKKHLPNICIIGASDSAFHTTLPFHSKIYALPREVTESLDIYRFGYHGLSLQSTVRTTQQLLGFLPPRIIVCHLGSGSSITAIKEGQSIDTSMGFTPLEGLPMQTRIGMLDPGALPYLAQHLSLTVQEYVTFFSSQCGLLGISTRTGDMRSLLALEAQGDLYAQQAINFYVYAVQKYIGAYIVVLGGLDLLIFTGGIGEHAASLRSRICQKLTLLGIQINEDKNNEHSSFIENMHSITKIAVLTTNESLEIALEVKRILSMKNRSSDK